MTRSLNTQSGSTLIFILILLLIISMLSITLFQSSLQEVKNSHQFQDSMKAFYATEACLLQIKHDLTATNKALVLIQNCKSKNCVNPYMLDINLAKESLNWWETHGVGCSDHVWQYAELIASKPNKDYIYRISVYNRRYLLLQLYIDKRFSPPIQTTYSWRQIY